MKKSSLSHRYARIMISSYFPFALFVLLFSGLFIAASLNIRIQVIKTYECKLLWKENTTYLIVEAKVNNDSSEIYLYKDKNQFVYKMESVGVSYQGDSSLIQVKSNKSLTNLIDNYDKKVLHVEIPQGNVSLLRRMFPLGELMHEK